MFLYLIASKQRLSELEPSRKDTSVRCKEQFWFITGYIVYVVSSRKCYQFWHRNGIVKELIKSRTFLSSKGL